MTEELKLQIITDEVCKHYETNPISLQTKSHKRDFVEPRQVIYYFAKFKTKLYLHQIGDRFGQSHSNVLHGIRTICNLEQVNGFSKVTTKIGADIEAGFKAARNQPVKVCPYCNGTGTVSC